MAKLVMVLLYRLQLLDFTVLTMLLMLVKVMNSYITNSTKVFYGYRADDGVLPMLLKLHKSMTFTKSTMVL